jgi:hypothetical protein
LARLIESLTMKATSRSAQMCLERLGQPRGGVLVQPLDPELEGGDRPCIQRARQPVREIPAHVERRDQVELAGDADGIGHQIFRVEPV